MLALPPARAPLPTNDPPQSPAGTEGGHCPVTQNTTARRLLGFLCAILYHGWSAFTTPGNYFPTSGNWHSLEAFFIHTADAHGASG